MTAVRSPSLLQRAAIARALLHQPDILLLDDVQFVAHRRETQAELLRLVDQMQASGRQIVLSSDRPPADIEAFDERLLRRVAGGLVIDIAPPDYETRVAILRRKAEERQVKFQPRVLEAVAGLALESVRELIGALNRLVAFQAAGNGSLDADQARLVLGVRARAADVPVEGAVAEEAADLIYHLAVLMKSREIGLDRAMEVLNGRRG